MPLAQPRPRRPVDDGRRGQRPAARGAAVQAGDVRPLKILVAEDHPVNQQLISSTARAARTPGRRSRGMAARRSRRTGATRSI